MSGALSEAGPPATAPRGRRRRPDFAARLATSRALVGYTAEDEARVRATSDAVLPHAEALADAVYRHLLAHVETAGYFALPDGRPDRAQIAARAATLKAWVQRLVEAPLDERMAEYLAGVALAHTGRRGDGSKGVKGRYLLLTMGFAYALLASLLGTAISGEADLAATLAAWSKLLTIGLDLFFAVYASVERVNWY